MEPLTIGFIGGALFLFLILAGLPIAFSALFVAIAGNYAIAGFEPAMKVAGYMPFATMTNYSFTVIPLFIIMGYFAFHGGITKNIFFAARQWFGHLPGGLAIAVVFGNAGFAAASGDSLASATVFGRIAVPELKKHGYDPKLACGCIASSGTMASMIPPSGILVIYGILAEQSIGALLIAGILPGILEALSYSTMIGVRVALNPALGPPLPAVSLKEKISAVKGVWGVLILAVLVIGGMYGGFFTPTEAGAAGALGAFSIALFSQKLKWSQFKLALLETTRTCSMLFVIIMGILIFVRFLALSGVIAAITDFVISLPVPPVVTLLAIMLVCIMYGFFMSAVGVLMLTVPVFAPAMIALGIDPILFGILLVRACEVGTVTPPVGMTVFALRTVIPDVSLQDMYRGVLPFVVVDLINVILLIVFPGIALFLPSIMR